MKKVLTGVVVLALSAAGCGGSSDSEELAQTRAELAQTRAGLAQTRAELDALKGQVAGITGLMGTHQTPTTTVVTATTVATTTVAPFDSVDWHSFYDWCLANRGYRGVDCDDWADDLQEVVNRDPEFEDCFLKAAKWSVVESTSDMNAPLVRNLWVPKRIACRELESSAATTAPPRAP